MTTNDRKLGAFGALVGGLGRALQWRVVLLWALGLLLPTIVAVLPWQMALSERLDHSVYARQIAERFDLGWMFEVMTPMFAALTCVRAKPSTSARPSPASSVPR